MVSRNLIHILVLFTALAPLSGLADSKSAQKALDKANAKYFEELMKIPKASTADKMRLKSEILQPAVSTLTKDQQSEIKAQQQKTGDTKDLFKKATPEQMKAKREKREEYMKALSDIKEMMKKGGGIFKSGSTGGGTLPGSGGGAQGAPAQAPESSAPEPVVLDGSAIPRELEFSGKSKPKAPAVLTKPTGPSSR